MSIPFMARPSGFTASLIGRGVLMLAFGAIAVRWPQASLVPALISAGAVLAASGAYEMSLALDAPKTSVRWPVLFLDGIACIVFSLITLGFPSLTMTATLLVAAGWFTLYAAFCASLALLLWARRGPRLALGIWSVINLAIAVVAVLVRRPGMELVLYAGAAYAALFGAAQLIAGMWVRGQLSAETSHPVGWQPAPRGR